MHRFPPNPQDLSEDDLDPYFVNFESGSKDLETLLQGSMEKVNRRTLTHHSALAEDLAELGARYNAFSLSEQSQTLAAAIEKTGQAVDNTYIAGVDLSSQLSATFAEPMRESAQFAGVLRSVLRYRVLKRVQEEMTKDELEKKRYLLESLERSEMEAKRIDEYLTKSGTLQSNVPKRSTSSGSTSARASQDRPRNQGETDTASIDSDFPPTHGEPSHSPPPSAQQGAPGSPQQQASEGLHRKTSSAGGGNFVTNKIFGRINHAIHGIVDVDPERTRRDQIGKTRESLVQVLPPLNPFSPNFQKRQMLTATPKLEQALEVARTDVKDASAGVLKDMQRFQKEKEEDLKRYMVAFARCHVEWAKRNQASWEEAKHEVENIEANRNT